MAEGGGKQLLASIRFYGDKSNTIHLIDPALIQDFVSLETFNFNIPHLVYKVNAGEKIAEPVQVFAISENEHQLLEPPKRRVFDNKRRSDVLLEIFDNEEKVGKKKKSVQAKANEKLTDDAEKQSNPSVSTNQTKAVELKAMEKKIKDDAKAFAKSLDQQIISEKIEKLKQNKLSYAEDVTEIQNKQKEINDLKMAIELQKKEFEAIKAKHEQEIYAWQVKSDKGKELLLKSKKVIEMLKSQRGMLLESTADTQNTTESFVETLETLETSPTVLAKDMDLRLLAKETRLRDVTNLSSISGSDLGDNNSDMQARTFDMQTNSKVLPLNANKGKSFNDETKGSDSPKDKETVKGFVDEVSQDQGYFPSDTDSNTRIKANKQNKENETQSSKHNKHRGRYFAKGRKLEESSDEENDEIQESPAQIKSRNVKRVKKTNAKILKQFEKEQSVETDDYESESCHEPRTKKKPKRLNYVPTRKYEDMHSTSESDSDDGKKKRFSRPSDDEYLSDDLQKSNHPDYRSYKEKTGKKRHMYHLKHGITIKYEIWDKLKKTFDVKQWLRILIHAMFKEDDLIDKVFKLAASNPERLPGRSRSEFTLEEKAVIRRTFFCKVDELIKHKKSADFHKNNWKAYISEHINSLVNREKAKRQQRELRLKRKAKQARQLSSSSSDDSMLSHK